MTEIKFYKSPWKGLKLLLISSMFVAVGIWLLLENDDDIKFIAWVSICFFGLGIPIAIFHLFDRRAQIILDLEGVFDRTAKTDKIPWNVIADTYLRNTNGQKFICLSMNEEVEKALKGGQDFTWKDKLNEQFGFTKIHLNLGQIKVDEEELTLFIKKMADANETERREIFSNYKRTLNK